MSIKLNRNGLSWAKNRIAAGEFEVDKNKKWADLAATNSEIDRYFDTHSPQEVGLWFLGEDTDYPVDSNQHWIYPIGDLSLVHKSAIEEAIKKAKASGHKDILAAAEELLKAIH